MAQTTRCSTLGMKLLARRGLPALIALSACGGGPAEPNLSPIRPDQVNGNWTFQLTDTAGCGGEDFAHGTITARVALESEPPDIFAFVDRTRSTWRSGGVSGWVGGWFGVSVPGGVLLNFAVGPADVDSDRVVQVLGELSGSYQLTGSATDPAAGPVPALSANPCTYQVLGTRDP